MSPPSSRMSNGDAQLIEKFIKDLDATSDQIQKLLDTVRVSELDFAAIKTELRILCENVKDISRILRGGDGSASIVTKVALLEQKVKELEEDLEKADQKDETVRGSQKSMTDIVLAENQGKWQMKVALATGVVSLLAQALTAILGHVKG